MNCGIFKSGKLSKPEISIAQPLMLSDWLLTSVLKLFYQIAVTAINSLLTVSKGCWGRFPTWTSRKQNISLLNFFV